MKLEDEDEMETVSWYYKLERCHDKEICANETEIDDFV